MRLERKSLLACTLLLLTGCSAARHSRALASESDSLDRVPLPIHHADEYDTDNDNYDYEYESSPSREDEPLTPRPILPPATPMREPVPAPPAIGVSRVKSVSWLRRSAINSERDNCGDNTNVDGCTTGDFSPLSQSYFVEGCDTPPQTTRAPSLRDRKKTKLMEVVRSWNLRKRTRTHQEASAPRNCGEQNVAALGGYAPGGCTQTFPPHDAVRESDEHSNPKYFGPRSGSLADPLSENGWEQKATHHNNPGELMELRQDTEQRSDLKPQPEKLPHSVPPVPADSEIGPTPALPIPLPVDPNETIPAPVEQQVNPNSVKTNTKPPLWPRLGQPAPKPANLPVVAPTLPEDFRLPLVQPSRRI